MRLLTSFIVYIMWFLFRCSDRERENKARQILAATFLKAGSAADTPLVPVQTAPTTTVLPPQPPVNAAIKSNAKDPLSSTLVNNNVRKVDTYGRGVARKGVNCYYLLNKLTLWINSKC